MICEFCSNKSPTCCPTKHNGGISCVKYENDPKKYGITIYNCNECREFVIDTDFYGKYVCKKNNRTTKEGLIPDWCPKRNKNEQSLYL